MRSQNTEKYERGYRFTFNGQLTEDDVSDQSGSHLSAEFWMYDTRLGRRWNVDPKPNPSISNYNCYAGNPIWYSDTKGDTIRINYTEGENNQLRQFTYSPGIEYSGNNNFLSETISALNKTNEENAGSKMINELHGSENDITIMRHQKNVANGLDIGFNPDSKMSGMNQEGKTEAPNFISLGHELAHTWDELNGTLDRSPWLSPTILEAEKFATHIENQLRAEHGLLLRTHYGLRENEDGSYSGFGRIIKGNESLYYNSHITIELPDAGFVDDNGNRNRINIQMPYRYK